MKLFAICFFMAIGPRFSAQVRRMENGIAAPEIVAQIVSQDFAPRCTVKGKALDLLFILDSSGSLKNKFQDELNVIKEIVNIVAIDEDATRVALVQYSGIQRTEFHFNTFYNKRNVLQAVDTLRHVSGITKTGAALKYARQELSAAHGMRGPEVQKLIFLLSDGRTHDYPDDKIWADKIRQEYRGIDIWAYGTGDYVAIGELINITQNENKIVTNKNMHMLEQLFAEYRGVEVCEEVPVCIPGSDNPLDLMFIFDASRSLTNRFLEQVNFMRRVLNNINIHPQAVRLSLITYSGTVILNFDFKKYRNNDDALDHFLKIRAINGTTRTQKALRLAFNTFEPEFGARNASVPKMAIVITDGHSLRNPAVFARRLVRLKNITVAAVAVSPLREIDYGELVDITDQHRERVFTVANLDTFESWFLQYIGFGCRGLNISKDETEPYVRGPTDTRCTSNALIFLVRTKEPFHGFLYARDYFGVPDCMVHGDGKNEIKITVIDGSCGLKKMPVVNGPRQGYQFNLTFMIQFDTDVITVIDQSLEAECLHEQAISNIIAESRIKSPFETPCEYTIRKFGKDGCVALDGRVGESMDHRWECRMPASNYRMLVHDCYAESDVKSLQLLDENGCHLHSFIMEDPVYPRRVNDLVHADMDVFKFPGAQSVRFRCLISLCDMEAADPCKYQIPPVCNNSQSQKKRKRRDLRKQVKTKPGFIATFEVETRRLNVLESENLKPRVEDINYCSTYSLY